MNYKKENRIPWLFTDFDDIKDFPWLFPDLEKCSFSLDFSLTVATLNKHRRVSVLVRLADTERLGFSAENKISEK